MLVVQDISISDLCGVLNMTPVQRCWEVLVKHDSCCSRSVYSENYL